MNAWKLVALLLLSLGWMLAAHVATAAAQDDAPMAAAEAHHEDQAAEGSRPNPLVFDPDLAIFTAIIFLLLLAVLGKFAWPSIVTALDEREQIIASNIASAEEKHEEAKRLLAAHEEKLAAAAGEVRELLEEARRDAEHTKSRIVAEAKQAADEERTRAVREVEQAKDSAMHELAITSANLAVDLAGKVVREQLTKEKREQIVRDALSNLAAAEPSQN